MMKLKNWKIADKVFLIIQKFIKICYYVMIFKKEEIEIFRNPTKYITWFESLLREINRYERNKKEALLHIGGFKEFYEEIFPTASILKIKEQEWKESRFRNIIGNQSYDVEIENHSLKYLEVDCTHLSLKFMSGFAVKIGAE